MRGLVHNDDHGRLLTELVWFSSSAYALSRDSRRESAFRKLRGGLDSSYISNHIYMSSRSIAYYFATICEVNPKTGKRQ